MSNRRTVIETACPRCGAFQHHPQDLDERHGFIAPMQEVAGPDLPEMWICLVDAEFSCNGYLSSEIADSEAHARCGQFALVKISESPVLEERTE